jgi:aspartate racemase
LEYVRPTAGERGELNRIIMDELVCSVFKPEAVAFHQRVIDRMRHEGCDAVVLGCTEMKSVFRLLARRTNLPEGHPSWEPRQ